MRIVHLSRYYLPHPGGIQRAMHDIARACVVRGDEVRAIVAAERPWPARRSLEGVRVEEMPSFGAFQGVPFTPTYLGFRRRDAEVVHLHESWPVGTLATLLHARGPLVVSWHMDVFRQRTLRPLHTALARRVLARAAAIHVADLSVVERSTILGPFRDKIRPIPYIVDVARFRRDERHPAALRIRDWAGGAPIALFVGRFVYYKGLDVLIDALARTDRVRLVLVGDGPLRESVLARVAERGVADRVLLLGALSDADLVGAYSGADLFVLPSTLAIEAFGLVQVEAMAARLPVISTRLGTGVETVNRDGETGLVVQPSDVDALAAAIARLAGDDALRARLGAAALARTADFAAERLVDRYRALYAEALR